MSNTLASYLSRSDPYYHDLIEHLDYIFEHPFLDFYAIKKSEILEKYSNDYYGCIPIVIENLADEPILNPSLSILNFA